MLSWAGIVSVHGYTGSTTHARRDDVPATNYVPMVIEQSGRGERAYDIFSRL